MGEYMIDELDWSLSESEFRNSIMVLIAKHLEQGKVIPLPVAGDMDTLQLMLAAIHCNNCSAQCCKAGKDDIVSLTRKEFDYLVGKYGSDGMVDAKECGIKMPCRFLFSGDSCSIYADRPLVCMFYPMQPGGKINSQEVLAVASSCPQARAYALQVYMRLWEANKKVNFIGLDEAQKMADEMEERANAEMPAAQ